MEINDRFIISSATMLMNQLFMFCLYLDILHNSYTSTVVIIELNLNRQQQQYNMINAIHNLNIYCIQIPQKIGEIPQVQPM